MSSFNLTRRHLLALVAGAAAIAAMPGLAFAQGLDEARLLGYLGERPDGYLAQRANDAPAWSIELMESINSQRELKYKELALKNGTSLEAVQLVAGEKIIENLPVGTYYMDAGGTWMQK